MSNFLRLIATIAIATSIFGFAGTTGALAGNYGNGGHGKCPTGTTPFQDIETGMWVCQHGTVTLSNGHPAYDEKAACTPGETREFKVPHKNDSGFRIVRQVCSSNYHGPEGDHAPKHIVTGY